MNLTHKKKILILSSNPKNTRRLRSDEEISKIKYILQSNWENKFEVIINLATTVANLQAVFLKHRPNIVHFCGHGELNGLLFENKEGKKQLIQVEAIANLFKLLGETIECVVLNACYSQVLAKAINQNIDCVIGMEQYIGDQTAIRFAEGFYNGLANKKSYIEAFELGVNQIHLESIPEKSRPIILFKSNSKERPPIIKMEESTAYKWDIFLSYDPSPDWAYRKFTSLFKKRLKQFLREDVPWKDSLPIFDRNDQPISDEDIRQTIPHSLCLIALCSPSYFNSESLVQEFTIMLQREQRLGRSDLVILINVHGSQSFPSRVRQMKMLDWHEYSILSSEKNEVLFGEFSGAVRKFSKKVAYLITNPPPWNDKFYHDIAFNEVLYKSLLQKSKRDYMAALSWR